MRKHIFALSLLLTKIDMKKSDITIQDFELTEEGHYNLWYTTDASDFEVEISAVEIAAKVPLDDLPPNVTLDQIHHEKMLRFRLYMPKHIQEDILKEIISELKVEA